MRFRKLRIAWSVVSGTICVLLIAFWVRSYVWRDACYLGSHVFISSCYGQISFDVAFPPHSLGQNWRYWRGPAGSTVSENSKREFAVRNLQMFSFRSFRSFQPSCFPHWSIVVPFAAFTIAPWLRQISYCFSLRTLLIATTLVAVVLGAVVYAASRSN